eukprot:1153247-Pelagomonas_calceolata.AAC.1
MALDMLTVKLWIWCLLYDFVELRQAISGNARVALENGSCTGTIYNDYTITLLVELGFLWQGRHWGRGSSEQEEESLRPQAHG